MSRASARADLAARRDEITAAIRQAAIAEFAANGLHGASTQAIADRAGITKTRLHYYIRSKEDLYVEALRHILTVWADLFHGLDPSAGPEAFLRDYIRRKLRHALENPDVARMFTGEVMRGAPLLRPLWDPSRQATQAAARLISGWIDAGLIRPVDPILLQIHIWALTQHHALHLTETRFMLGLPDTAPLETTHIEAQLTDLILGALIPKDKGHPDHDARATGDQPNRPVI